MAKAIGQILINIAASTARLEKDLYKARSQIERFQKNVASIGKSLNLVLGFSIAKEGAQAIASLTRELGNLVREGERAGAIKQAFAALGGNASVIEAARTQIRGLADDLDLMAIANKGLIKGIPGFQDSFVKIADLGARVAKALGKDVTESIETLTTAIVTGNARALRGLPFTFSDTSNKALVTKEALAQLSKVLDNFNPVAESTYAAMFSMEEALGDVREEVAIALNQNPELAKAFREIEAEIRKINWTDFANGIATVSVQLLNLAKTVGPQAVKILREIAAGFDVIFGQGLSADAARVTKEITNIEKEIFELDQTSKEASKNGGFLNRLMYGSAEDRAEKRTTLEAQLKNAKYALEEIYKQINTSTKQDSPIEPIIVDLDLANDKAEKLGAKLSEALSKQKAEALKNSFSQALEAGNTQAASHFLNEYLGAIRKQAQAQVAEYRKVNPQMAEDLENEMVSNAIIPMTQEFAKQMQEADRKAADEFRREHEEAFQQAIGFFKPLFSEFINTGTIDWGNLLRSMAVDFVSGLAAEMATKLGGGFLEGLLDPSGIGKKLGEALVGVLTGGAAGGGIIGGITDFLDDIPIIGGLFGKGGVFEGQRVMAAANGMTVNGPTLFRNARGLGIMGEAGPEAILPLTKVGGVLGVKSSGGGGININIDARGAEAGVEAKIRQVFSEMQDHFIATAVQGTMDAARRGVF